ncbi:Fur family transcriptional regulator [Breznakiella homolactica]|uniref:Transcriptional repressor n=1 Tax=Breznakiella homolactica TaxID=2798577 RepID=A0A7T8BAS5_9SPIR|nr:transcriptional repressor [Breznakiella homolactica]QQO09320.1 transcriptional repressor [Breznakiella homolactica]
MTRTRGQVLDILNRASEPLSAAGVYGLMENSCDQATVYRSLHYLESSGQAESFVLYCQEHGAERYFCSLKNTLSHTHWFHCEQCHCFIDMGSCTITGLIRKFEEEQGAEVRSHILYFTGICPGCRKNAAGGPDHTAG